MGQPIIRVDKGKNRIYVTFNGFMNVAEANQLIEDYSNAVESCETGFTVLSDLSNYKPGTPEVTKIFEQGPKLAGDAGCLKVARVVTKMDPLGSMQIDRLARETSSYPAKHFESHADAEIWLDSD